PTCAPRDLATQRRGDSADIWPNLMYFGQEFEQPWWTYGPRPEWNKLDWVGAEPPGRLPPIAFDPPTGPPPGVELDPTRSCTGLSPQITPPAFGSLADGDTVSGGSATQQCFWNQYGPGLTDWPDTSCGDPCLFEVTSCAVPSQAEQDAALATFGLVQIDQGFLDSLPDGDVGKGDVPLVPPATADELAFVKSALALLLANLDLVEWALCLAASWSVDEPAETDPEADTAALLDCVLGMLAGGSSIYLIATFGGGSTGATGGGTRRYSFTPDGQIGAVIPVRGVKWVPGAADHAAGTPDGLCAAITLAGVILHEFVHMCEDDTNPDCTSVDNYGSVIALCCSEEQRMTQSMFQWAMSQRYSCLSTPTARCKLGDPTQFASSDQYVGYNP
ncbi:MAG: hypothetical protein ABMA64_42145, partial [Myxococcota bacterium]